MNVAVNELPVIAIVEVGVGTGTRVVRHGHRLEHQRVGHGIVDVQVYAVGLQVGAVHADRIAHLAVGHRGNNRARCQRLLQLYEHVGERVIVCHRNGGGGEHEEAEECSNRRGDDGVDTTPAHALADERHCVEPPGMTPSERAS